MQNSRYIILLCLCSWFLPVACGAKATFKAEHKPQYAYVSTTHGILSYLVGLDGKLTPLPGKSAQGPSAQVALLLDYEARTLYAVWKDGGKIFAYHIGNGGILTLVQNSPTPIDPDTSLAVIDTKLHFLFLTTGDHLKIYDVASPKHIYMRESKPIPAEAQKIICDPIKHQLFLFTWQRGPQRQPIDSKMTIYAYRISQKHQVEISQIASSFINGLISDALYNSGYLIVSKWDNTLTVYKHDKHLLGKVETTSIQQMPLSVKGNFPQQVAYRKLGSFLYVGLYHITDSARYDPPSSTLIGYHLSKYGKLYHLATAAQWYVTEPLPFIDSSGHLMYVVSQTGSTIDTYKITRKGYLSRPVSRLVINSPAEMVFFAEH